MHLSLGTLFWFAGTVQFALAFQQLCRANPHEEIPKFLGRPTNHPGEIYVYRAIALVLLMISSSVWAELLGFWSVLLILVGAIPTVILNVQHNRRVQAGPSQSAG